MKKIKLTFAIVIVLMSASQIYSQVSQQWAARYSTSGNHSDGASDLVIDTSGNVYVTGYIEIVSGSNYDFVTIKYNSAGIAQWIRTYNGPSSGEDFGRAIAVDNSGNVYVTGYSPNTGSFGTEDFATIKYNSSGVQQWVTRYNGPANQPDFSSAISVDMNGNVYVAGSSYGNNGPYYDYTTVKYNSSGVQQWVQVFNGPGNQDDNAYAMVMDDSANVYVTGTSVGSGTFNDFCTIKYNSSGVQQWATRYNGPFNNYDYPFSLVLDATRNVYVAGVRRIGTNYATTDYVTVKYNSSGVQQWVSVYNGAANDDDEARSVDVDVSGNVFVTGSSKGIGTDFDYATIKYNSSGVQQWVQRYNGPLGNGPDYNNILTLDNSGNVYVTGGSWASSNNTDYTTVKYNTLGVQQWLIRYDGTGSSNDDPASIAVDRFGNVYVTGDSYGGSTNYDFATIKYSQVTAAQQISNEVTNQFSLSQNFPNPFNPKTIINYELPITNYVLIKVYDVLGNEVATLVNEKKNPGTYKVEFDGSNLSSGIYYYKLSAGEFTETKKMILLK